MGGDRRVHIPAAIFARVDVKAKESVEAEPHFISRAATAMHRAQGPHQPLARGRVKRNEIDRGIMFVGALRRTAGTEVEVGIAVDRLGSSSVTYRIGIFGRDEADPAAQGHFTHVYVDRETRRPKSLPESRRRKLESLA